DHDVRPAQPVAGLGGDVQRDDAVELVGGALAQLALRRAAAGQLQFLLAGLLAVPAFRELIAQRRLPAPAVLRAVARQAPALPVPAPAAEEDDRAEQQRHRNRDADAKQGHVGHLQASFMPRRPGARLRRGPRTPGATRPARAWSRRTTGARLPWSPCCG